MGESRESINAKTRLAYNLAAQRYHELFHDEMNEKEYDRRLLDFFIGTLNTNALVCDAGCGPSGHIGRYLFRRGIRVVGVDISETCVAMAQRYNPEMLFGCGDIGELAFDNATFDGIISYYSIIDTPKEFVGKIFGEFQRVLKPEGYLMVAVKAGTSEGYVHDLLGIETEIYFTLYTVEEITGYFVKAGFDLEFIERRNPYDFEIANDRIFAVGRKLK